MRRQLTLLLVLTGCLSLMACGNKPQQLQLPPERPTVTQPDVPE